MDFPTQYDKVSKEYISEAGSAYIQDYEYTLDKKGHKMLTKKDSMTDVYSMIQASKDSCDINLLMKRFALGDTEALNVNTGFYLDTTKMPTNIHEVYAMGLAADQYFEGLPVELKEKFDNSSSVYFTEMSNNVDSFRKKYDEYNDQFVDHSFDTDVPKENNYNE